MSSIRTRHWQRKGKELTSFVVDYVDHDGRRRLQTFDSEPSASAFKRSIDNALKAEPKQAEIKEPTTDGLDLLWGAADIGAFIGTSSRSAFYLLEQGSIPAKKIGRQWVARKSALQARFCGT